MDIVVDYPIAPPELSNDDQRQFRIAILSVAITLVDKARPFGHVLGGVLRVRCKLIAADWRIDGDITGPDHGHFDITHYSRTETDDVLYHQERLPRPEELVLDDYRLMDYSRAYFLPVIEHTPGILISLWGLMLSRLDTGQYTRIGYATFMDDGVREICASQIEEEVTNI